MKKYSIFILISLLTIFFFGCNVNAPMTNTFDNAYDETAEELLQPVDLNNDVARSVSRDFTFETLLPVRLNLDADFYSGNFEPLSGDGSGVFVQLEDKNGNTVFGGITDSDGVLDQVIRMPAAPEDMILSLHAAGYESRMLIIPDMVNYEEVNRIIAMISESEGSRALLIQTDSDGDGIPDVYDAYPSDPDSAFSYLMPADGYLSVAYEDLFGRAQAGDADYNDFLAHYNIEESSAESGITEIHVEAEAAVKLAGYNHSFGIRINSFLPPADLTVNYIDRYGNAATYSERIIDYPNPGETSLEVVLFENSESAVGKTADFTLSFTFGDIDDNPQSPDVLSRPPYNPYLVVKNTGHDIHLIGEEPVFNSANPDDTFRDADGFPWGILVPPGAGGWSPPAEGQRIEEPYPRFTRWRESGGELSPDWYLHSDPWTEDPTPESAVLFFASDRDGDFEIYSQSVETGELIQLTSNNSTDKHPAVSPDGTMVAFVSDRSGSWGIYTMNADGSGISGKLVDLTGSFYGYPSWSPDGARIAYNNGFEIYIMNSDGSGSFNMTNTVFTNEIEPAWSPDGTLIAFSSSADGDFEIHTMKTDGSGEITKLTDNSSVDRMPTWSADGTQIAYATNIDSNYDIYVVNSDGSSPYNLTASVENEISPSWSESGLAFVKNDDIFIVQPGSLDLPMNFTDHTAIEQDPSW